MVSVLFTLRAARVRSEGNACPVLTELIDAAVDGLQRGLQELRDLAAGLYPAVLTAAGVGPAVRGLADTAHVAVDVRAVPAGRLAAHIERAAYFIVAEALANVEKHARASRATVELQVVRGRLIVDVSDDGGGGADPAKGSGLVGLRGRVTALGGSWSVSSGPRTGTRLVASIPLTLTQSPASSGWAAGSPTVA